MTAAMRSLSAAAAGCRYKICVAINAWELNGFSCPEIARRVDGTEPDIMGRDGVHVETPAGQAAGLKGLTMTLASDGGPCAEVLRGHRRLAARRRRLAASRATCTRPVAMTAQRFVFLEITDPEIGPLLQRMQWILSGVEPRHPVHLTLRGPYRREVPPKVLQKLRTTLRGEVLHIGGVGRFTNRHEEVVFLDVDSPSLRTVWWKRDYPIKAHGYRPHISLYRGRDSVFARGVTDLL